MTSWRRFGRFNVVGALGIGVQIGVLAALTGGLGLHYLAATVAAVGAALVHNFAWHHRWTWPDGTRRPRDVAAAFARFVLANGVVSLTGNVGVMAVLSGGLGVPVVAANAAAIAAAGLVNFWLAGRLVFAPAGARS
jgi:putative flippase GtrA